MNKKYKVYSISSCRGECDVLDMEETQFHEFISPQQVLERVFALAVIDMDSEELHSSEFYGDCTWHPKLNLGWFCFGEEGYILVVREDCPYWDQEPSNEPGRFNANELTIYKE